VINLKQAAHQALVAMEDERYVTKYTHIVEAITALRKALEQTEQEPSQWRDMVVVSLVREGINKHKARELADHFATPPAAQRPWVGLTDEDRRKFAAAQYGWEDLLIAAEAKLKERNRGATTHCQCAACKNGNIHDSDCSVHNGDALPVGPCDCSLATPPVYQPAANEAVEILQSLGYVYEPTYTGLAWVAKKSAQPEQEPAGYDKTEINCFVQSLYDQKMQEGKHGHYETLFHVVHQAIKKVAPPKQQAEPIGFITPPGPITQYTIPTQRQWVGLTDEEILSTDPWEILRADPWMGTSDSNINPYQILLKVRTLEAKLKERNT
jgi:cytochrome c-type biogenesis protein CcmH/NrfF